MYSGGALRKKAGGGNMSPEHYLSTDGKGFLDLLTLIGYKYFMIPPKGRYLTILVPDAKLLKELKGMIESNDREQERKAYQLLDLLFIPHNLSNYDRISGGIKDSADGKYVITNRHSDKFVVSGVDSAKKQVTIIGEGDKPAILQPMNFNPVNQHDYAVVFMSIATSLPKIYGEKIKGGAKFEKFAPVESSAKTGGGGANRDVSAEAVRYIKYLYLIYTQPNGCLLPAYSNNSIAWNMQWQYLPEAAKELIVNTQYTPEFEQLVREDRLPHNPMLIKYLLHDTNKSEPMHLISQLAGGVLKCSADCSKNTCGSCFKIHTCNDSHTCPMRGTSVADLIRMLSARGLVDHMSQIGISPAKLTGLVDEYSVAGLTNMAADTFSNRGQDIMQYARQLSQLVARMRSALGDDHVASILVNEHSRLQQSSGMSADIPIMRQDARQRSASPKSRGNISIIRSVSPKSRGDISSIRSVSPNARSVSPNARSNSPNARSNIANMNTSRLKSAHQIDMMQAQRNEAGRIGLVKALLLGAHPQ
jgi:hypothetical protein